MPKNSDEFNIQCQIFEWAELKQVQLPELALLNGSLNGIRLTIGNAVKAKRIGMKKGYPDLFLPVARGGYFGLYIELKPKWRGIKKRQRPKPTKEQVWWLQELAKQGYSCHHVNGYEAAISVIEQYLTMSPTLYKPSR